MRIGTIVCPACGAAVVVDSEKCDYCGNAYSFVLKSGKYLVRKDIEYLLMNHFYEQAANCIINMPIDSEIYVYKSIIALGGRPAFLHVRKNIDEIIRYLDMALAMGNNVDAAFVRAYVEYDYFERKNLNRKKTYDYYYDLAVKNGINRKRINIIETMLNNKMKYGGQNS